MLSNSDDIHFDTRPPMLDRTNYESWSQQIQLYCRGKENGLLILQSIDQGPFELRTTRNTLGTTPEGDVRATNIMLQGLPKDIYKLINHNIKAKAIWDNVKLLLAGSELTKEDRESQLYDEFKRFKMLPGRQNQRYFAQGNGAAGNGGAQNRAGNVAIHFHMFLSYSHGIIKCIHVLDKNIQALERLVDDPLLRQHIAVPRTM
ncbi:hypothetical protein Tco_0557425 [Tanacetum coccineum]